MQLKMSKEQFREMLLAAVFYSWVRGYVTEPEGKDYRKYEKLEKYLLQIAQENNLTDLVKKFRGELVPSEEIVKRVVETMDEYNNEVFWEKLVIYLGQRDFWRSLSPEARREVEKEEFLPIWINDFYQKYEEEFEKYGVERLEIQEEEG